MPKYLSGRSKLTRQSELSSDRYRYLSIENAEPNLGDPLVGPSSVTAKPTPPGQQFIMVSVEGSIPGERYWIPNQGGIIPGSISVFDDNVLVGALSSITQLNFVGAAITASVSIASSNLATIRVFSPGNNREIIFNTANEFSTSTKLKFDPSNGLLTAGDRIIVGAGGTVITTTGVGSVGIGTTNPTQELHVQGDLRLTGTIYDSINQPGTNTQLLVKNNFGGLTWIDQGTIRSGAGGTYTNIQFNNNAGLVDGAPNFVFDDINSRIGIGSTQPKVLLDVLGISSFKGGTTIDNLNVTGVTTTRNLTVTGVSTVGFVTGTSAFFTGVVTATKFVGEVNVSNLYVTGISTFLQKVNINSDLGVTGITTTQNLQVYQSTTLNRLNATGVSTFTTIDINGGEIDVTRIGTQNLNVSGVGTFTSQVNINNLNVTGVGTFDNIKLDTGTISTNIGNLIIEADAGTTQINNVIYVTDGTESISKDTGSIVTEGGVGIERDLYVGGQVNLATSGGITTTGGDLYVRGDLYVSDDIFYDELFARNGYFTGITSTKDLNVTGIATIATLGVTGLTTTRNLRVIGVGTFDGLLDANAGATIDNIQIGISGDNEIDTSTGNLILDSFGGTVEITDQLIVSGISTFQGNVTLGDANTDTVTFTARVNSNVLPSTNGTLDLGGTSNRWSNIYATTFNGSFVGNADTASQVSTGTTTGTTTYFPTFVDSNNSTRGNEFLYTDAGISYNPSTNSLGIGTTNPGAALDVGIGSVYISNGDLHLNGTPFIYNTRDVFGGVWSNGGVDGTANLNNFTPGGSTGFTVKPPSGSAGSFGSPNLADMYETVSTRHDGTQGITHFNGLVGIGTTNPTSKLQVAGDVTPSVTNTYDLGTTTLKWNNIYANNFVGTITGNADTATKLATPREIDIDGDVIGVGIGTTFDGSRNVTIPTILSNTGVTAGTYGSSTQVGIVTVDAKGRITAASNVSINFSTATVQNADNIRTITRDVDASHFLTFVDADNSTAAYEALYTDAGISYNPSANLLTVPNIRPTAIQDTSGGTGTNNFVLTANGTGGWTWKVASTSGGSAAIGGITIQEDGSTVGNQLGITTVNFVGPGVTATAGPTGTANITVGDTAPAGTVIYSAASAAPTGYLKANGASLSTTTYATLFAAIEYTFGGSGASFNVPDLRNKFAVGSGSLYALSAAGGSADATLVSHTHGVTFAPSGTVNAFFVSRNRVDSHPANDAIDGMARGGDFADNGASSVGRGNIDSAGSSATNANLPPYLALLACIKY